MAGRIAGGPFDVAIVGAGVVGCAAARRFALAGARVIVIEKGPDILSGASKANSAILHTGFDAPPESLEWELVRAGREEYLAIRESLNLPLLRTGALLCAWTGDEAAKLEAIERQGRANGVANLTLMTSAAARATMPSLSDKLVAALEIADEQIIDPWSRRSPISPKPRRSARGCCATPNCSRASLREFGR